MGNALTAPDSGLISHEITWENSGLHSSTKAWTANSLPLKKEAKPDVYLFCSSYKHFACRKAKEKREALADSTE